MTPEEKKQLKEVYDFMQNMKRFDRIPLDVKQSLTRKLDLTNVPRIEDSNVTVASFTQTVNEAGASSYNVAKAMTGFKSFVDANGNIYTVATYD